MVERKEEIPHVDIDPPSEVPSTSSTKSRSGKAKDKHSMNEKCGGNSYLEQGVTNMKRKHMIK